jgi:hypothetical protein
MEQRSGIHRSWRWIAAIAVAGSLALAGTLFAPGLLAFPHQARFGDVTIHSTKPIDPRMQAILARAAALNAVSKIAAPLGERAIYLTDGGWRWTLLSLPSSRGAFAVTRPFSNGIVVNRSAIADDLVYNGAAIAGLRSLSGVIAHETTHLFINVRFGLKARLIPNWKIEGYCDHIAQESSLTDAEAAALRSAGVTSPALTYYDARRRVAQALASGTSVERLLEK